MAKIIENRVVKGIDLHLLTRSHPLSALLYHLFRWCYPLILRIASPFHPKAHAWVRGRSGLFHQIDALKGKGPFVWVHCASLGEFEQGRPVMEAIRAHYPNYNILLTFFSPSGYEHQRYYSGADHVLYLPMDGPRNARRFIEAVEPKLVIFVKYEFWFYYLKKLHYRQIPLLLISAFFRPNMSFFKWYGSFSRKMLTRFDRIFVQDESSLQLLRNIGVQSSVEVGGDTRFDRVLAIAGTVSNLVIIENFIAHKKTIVIGSSWQADEQLWATTRGLLKQYDLRLIIVPHDIDADRLEETQKKFPDAILYSDLEKGLAQESNTLIVDRVGLLATLYRYGWVNYVGGGLTSGGVHNVLEAAVYGRPVITGPRIEKYREACELRDENGLFPLSAVHPSESLLNLLEEWCHQPALVEEFGRKAGAYVNARTGSVDRILGYIQKKRLLTN